MSLAMAFQTYEGIIMSADKMIISTYEDSNKMLKTIGMPPTKQKLFLIEEKYGLSYTGTSSINAIPLSVLLQEYFIKNPIGTSAPDEWLLKLAIYFQNKLSNGKNIIFIMCGYYNNEQFTISTNTLDSSISKYDKNPRITYSGENEFVEWIINNKIAPFEYSKFTMQDATDLLCFINKTIYNLMYYGQHEITVSRECDVLAIYPNKSHWVKHETLKILHFENQFDVQ